MSGETTERDTSSDIKQIKKSLARHTFNVKFDLGNSDYKPLENIGIGAYGVVCSAVHKKTNDKVAIKKIPHVFEAETVTKRTYREIRILKHFQHDNIINIREILKPQEDEFKEIYVVLDLMESDLHRIIYTEQDLTEEHIRYFLYQILRGLKYIHSANVIHRDLKPSNILVNEDCHIRIGDFGMARGVSQQPEEPCYYMTQYVATRWYRAPEILLSLVEYGPAVDMWSVGCIFAEMLGRKHLFPGKNYLSQIKLIIGVLGSPSEDVLKLCQNDVLKRIIKDLGQRQAVSWKALFPKASRKALDLLSRMLTINPKERLTVVQALDHLFLSKYHDPDDEPICVPTFNFDFEKKEMSNLELHKAIYQEIMEFHQPKTPTLSFNAVLRPAPKVESAPEHKPDPAAETLKLLQMLEQEQQQQIDDHHHQQEQQQQQHKDEDVSMMRKEENVFKKPVLQPSVDVSVNTSALLPSQSGDVEMLSARSTDGTTQLNMTGKAGPKQEEKTQLKQQKQNQSSENKTISLDTKALVKQALLSNHLRQRTESSSEDTEGKPKGRTAAQRQKERDDNRKKRKEKANERLRKLKEKQGTSDKQLLSTADKELLKRWANMQTKIAPAVTSSQTHATSQTLAVSVHGGNLTLTPMNQTAITTAQFHTIHLPTNVNSGQIQGAQVQTSLSDSVVGLQFQPANCMTTIATTSLPTQGITLHTQDSHPDQLAGNPAESLQSNNNSPPSQPLAPNVSPPSISLVDNVSSLQSSQQQTNMHQVQTFLKTTDLKGMSIFPQGDIPPVTGYTVPNVNVSSSNSLPPQVQSFISTTQSCVAKEANQPQFQNQITSNQIPCANMNVPISSVNTTVPVSNSYTMVSNVNFDGLDFFKEMVQEGKASPSAPMQHTFQFEPYPDQLPQPRNSPQKRHSLETSAPKDFKANQPFLPDTLQKTQVHSSRPSSKELSPWDDHTFYNQQVPFSSYAQADQLNNEATAYESKESGVSFSCKERTDQGTASSRAVPSLKITCNPISSVQNQPDLIAMLSRQFSRSHVEDIFPPALSLTPKGTGGGYGVGADLDALMVDSQEHVESFSAHIEQSPLSSSLLADWLDVCGNISNADLEALTKELEMHSPMAVSYSDISLSQSYSSSLPSQSGQHLPGDRSVNH